MFFCYTKILILFLEQNGCSLIYKLKIKKNLIQMTLFWNNLIDDVIFGLSNLNILIYVIIHNVNFYVKIIKQFNYSAFHFYTQN